MEDIKHEKGPIEDVDYTSASDDVESQPAKPALARALQGRHMQMIAIGMALVVILLAQSQNLD